MNRRGLAMRGRRVLLLGLSYKRNTGDARETPARRLAGQLVALGAEVRGADPHVDPDNGPPGVVRVEPTAEELAAADAIVLLVDHSAFDLDAVGIHGRYVLDCRRSIRGPGVEYL
jgi:UDP-N-acetyl-D-mannosaminuronate dehydrogenase